MSANPDKWFSEFLGVGYRYHDIYMNVLLLFSSHIAAARLWNKTVDGWADDQIRLQFVEEKESILDYTFSRRFKFVTKGFNGLHKTCPQKQELRAV